MNMHMHMNINIVIMKMNINIVIRKMKRNRTLILMGIVQLVLLSTPSSHSSINLTPSHTIDLVMVKFQFLRYVSLI